MKLYPPVPIDRDDWAPSYTRNRGDHNVDKAFRFEDRQGAPAGDGRRYHGAWDIFAPAGVAVRSPADGVVVDARRSFDTTGPVYGGVTGVQLDNGNVVVLRHTQPKVGLRGKKVQAGEPIATVSNWRDGWPHAHMEVWKRWLGGRGYFMGNFIDPATIEWTTEVEDEDPTYNRYLEELPWTEGGIGPRFIQMPSKKRQELVWKVLRERGDVVSKFRAENGDYYVVQYVPGTYGDKFRFGPGSESWQNNLREQRERNTGRTIRPFTGRNNSKYPYPFV